MTVGIGLNANSASGVSLSPQIGLNFERKTQTASKTDVGYLTGGLSLTGAYNSRQGMQSVTMGATMGIQIGNRKGSAARVGFPAFSPQREIHHRGTEAQS